LKGHREERGGEKIVDLKSVKKRKKE